MKKWNIYITRKIPESGLDLIRKECGGFRINPHNRVLKPTEIQKAVQGCDAILSLLTDKIDAAVMDSAGDKLKIIANHAVGFENIDLPEATRRKIMVTNTPGVLTKTTAELAWALLFSVARRVVDSDRYTRSGKFKGWDPLLFLGQDISGKTLGIVGAGRIGTEFALMSKGFNMRVLYNSRRPNESLEKELGAKKTDLETLLKESDFISLHVNLNSESFHLIREKELKMMKSSAILINTSRGSVIDEKALVKALKRNWIFGAGLDVYEKEPDLVQGLTGCGNAVLTPHTGSASFQTRGKIALLAAENLVAGLNGQRPKNLLNPESLQ
ncbi:MAG: D-glycerate dehydrogenase [Elusimicrobia bacterium]|nr:D-glycerate dehydrogenase [Elusimicrobiota bacterium]